MKRDVVDSGFIAEMEKGFQAISCTYRYKTGNELWTFTQSLLEYSYIKKLNIVNKNVPFIMVGHLAGGYHGKLLFSAKPFQVAPSGRDAKSCMKSVSHLIIF